MGVFHRAWMWQICLGYSCALWMGVAAWAQKKGYPIRDRVYDFGFVMEDDKPLRHTFVIPHPLYVRAKIDTIYYGCRCLPPVWRQNKHETKITVSYATDNTLGAFSEVFEVKTHVPELSYRLRIQGHVLPKKTPAAYYFWHALGALRLPSDVLAIAPLTNAEQLRSPILRTFPFYNASNQAMRLVWDSLPPYVQVDECDTHVLPKHIGLWHVLYYPHLQPQPGYQLSTLRLQTNDSLQTLKNLYLGASRPSTTQAIPEPLWGLPLSPYALDTLFPEEERLIYLPVHNESQDSLHIQKVNLTCGQTLHMHSYPQHIAPNTSSHIALRVGRYATKGRFECQLKVHTLNKEYPIQSIQITGCIAKN